MTTPAIDKLVKKLEKEPNSLIFLQLVEEYRKEGYYDDALSVCVEGLRQHPNYWSARVALGRIHKEMGHLDHAREELEKVIQAVPDNLLANKLLGDIYMALEQDEDALKRYKLVQMLTPADSEVINNIQKLESRLSQTPSAPMPAVTTEIHPAEEESFSPTTVEMLVPKQFSTQEIKTEEFPHLNVKSELPPFSDELPDFLEKTSPGLKTETPAEFFDATMPGPTADAYAKIEPQPSADESANEQQQAESDSFDFPELEPATATKIDITQPLEQGEADELTTQTLAELYVQQGLIDKATKVYQKILLNEPDNKQIIQRLKELNPADALLAAAAAQEQKLRAASAKPKTMDLSGSNSSRLQDRLSEERRRKISTLESWLAAIRRERL
jgi:tetratricopeptide (TPR) repeat protein